jgi:hypothetical protein
MKPCKLTFASRFWAELYFFVHLHWRRTLVRHIFIEHLPKRLYEIQNSLNLFTFYSIKNF